MHLIHQRVTGLHTQTHRHTCTDTHAQTHRIYPRNFNEMFILIIIMNTFITCAIRQTCVHIIIICMTELRVMHALVWCLQKLQHQPPWAEPQDLLYIKLNNTHTHTHTHMYGYKKPHMYTCTQTHTTRPVWVKSEVLVSRGKPLQ